MNGENFQGRVKILLDRLITQYERMPDGELVGDKTVASLEKVTKMTQLVSTWHDKPNADITEMSLEELEAAFNGEN